MLTDPTGQTNLPHYFKRVFVSAQKAQQGQLDFNLPYEHVENVRLRLRRWHETLNEKWCHMAHFGFDHRFLRMWNFCLASCARAFGSGNCNVTQIPIARPR